MDLSQQNRDADEPEFAHVSTNSNQMLVPSQGLRQRALTGWNPSRPPDLRQPNYFQGSSYLQAMYPQIPQAPNVSIQNIILIPPYNPTGPYANIHRTFARDQGIYSFPSSIPLSLLGPSSIVREQPAVNQQRTLPPSFTPTQYINSTPTYPAITQSSNHAALPSNYSGSVGLPTISEMSTPEIVSRETTINNAAPAIHNVQAGTLHGPLTIREPSNANHLVLPETLSQGDAISGGPSQNDEPPHSPDVESLNALLDEILADEEWKNSASNRILNGLLTSSNVTSNGTEGDPLKDSTVLPPNLFPPVEASDPQMQVGQTWDSPVPASLKVPASPAESHSLIPHTPLHQQQQSTLTPSSANANRSTIARDVLRALRPPSTKRKRIQSEQSLSLLSPKRAKTNEVDNQPVITQNGPLVPRVSIYKTLVPPTSITPSDSVHTESFQPDSSEPNVVSTYSVPESNDKFISTTNATGIQTEILEDLDASENNTNLSADVLESGPSNGQSLSSMPNGHRISNGRHEPSPPSTSLSRDTVGGEVDIQTSSLFSQMSPAQRPQSTDETANSLTGEPNIFTHKTPTFDRMERIMSLSPAGPSGTPSETLPVQHNTNDNPSSSLSLGTIIQNRLPLFLPSESPSPIDEIDESLPSLAKSPKEPSPTSSIRIYKNRAYVLVPRIRKRIISVRENNPRFSQPEVRGKRPVEPELPQVEESRCRLTQRHCLWRDCRAILDSAEKLIKHTKIVHGGANDKEFYRCRWAGCTRLGTYFTSEDLTRHLKEHVHLLITCPYKGCDYETNQGRKLVSHIATKHDNQQDILKPSALPNRLLPKCVTQPFETYPAYYSVSIPVTAGLISKEQHFRLEPLIRDYIVGKSKPNQHNMGMIGSTSDLTSLTEDYAFQQEEPSKAFSPLKQMSPIINEIEVLEGNLLNSVIIMGMGYSTPSLPTDDADVAADVSFQKVPDTHEGLGTDLSPNLLQTAREERDFLEVESLL